MVIKNCPICEIGFNDETSYSVENWKNDTYEIHCDRCKLFTVTDRVLDSQDCIAKLKENKAKLSGLARILYEKDKEQPVIKSTNIEELLKDPEIPLSDDIYDKCRFIIAYVKTKTKHFGSNVKINTFLDSSVAFAENSEEFNALLNTLVEEKYITINSKVLNGDMDIALTKQSWVLFSQPNDASNSDIDMPRIGFEIS